MLPSIIYVKFVDELECYLLGAIAFVDIIFNKNYKKYTLIYFFLAFFAFYIVYSIFFKDYNTTRYILTDAIIQFKPSLPYLVIFAISPSFLSHEKKIVKALCVINVTICLILLFMGSYILRLVVFHIAYIGTTCFICAICYMLMSIKDDYSIDKRDLLVMVIMLCVGLGCTRAKYYGEFVFIIFFLFLYKPGMLRKFSMKYALLLIAVIGIFIAVGWDKFTYYFITGNSETFDPTVAQSFARPVLYATAGLILLDHFPFGSGLASFASYASADNYSNLYYEYGINSVWGLSEEYSDFICDAYYPSLAQFGIFGIILFIAFFVWIYSHLRDINRCNDKKYKYFFIIGASAMLFIFIESIGGTSLVQTSGMIAMMLLGFTASCAKNEDVTQYLLQTNNKKSFLKIKI